MDAPGLQGFGKKAKFSREAIPGRGDHHGECTVLSSGGTGSRGKENPLWGREERSRAHITKESATQVTKIERNKTK